MKRPYWGALLIGVLGWGCGDRAAVPSKPVSEAGQARLDQAGAQPSSDGKQAPTGPTHDEAGSATCTDWSTLDTETLPPLAQSRFAGLLQEVWKRVLDKHYDPTLGCLNWPALRLVYADKLAKVEDEAQACALINELLGELKQSHFHLVGNAAAASDDERRGSALPPMEVRWIEDRLVAVADDDNAVPPGSELVAIDGKPVAPLVEQTKARTHRPSEFAFAIARAVEARLSCARPGERHQVQVVPLGSEQPVTRQVVCQAPKGELVSLGNLRDIPTRVEHRMIEGTSIGYLAFDVWMLPMVQRVEAALADLRKQGCTALILDLRGNPGGVGAMAIPVARQLLAEPGSLGKLQFRGFAQEFNVSPGRDPFRGPVVLLVDEGTASTSEIFATGLRDLGRVKVVGGRASAGAALPSLIDELDGGAVLQYVVGDYLSPKGTVVEGKGVVPDVVVPETRADFAAKRDPVLAAAVELLSAS